MASTCSSETSRQLSACIQSSNSHRNQKKAAHIKILHNLNLDQGKQFRGPYVRVAILMRVWSCCRGPIYPVSAENSSNSRAGWEDPSGRSATSIGHSKISRPGVCGSLLCRRSWTDKRCCSKYSIHAFLFTIL